jgi:hypothetical protein
MGERYLNTVKDFSATSDEAKVLVDSLIDLGNVAATKYYGKSGMFGDSYLMDEKEYKTKNQQMTKALLGFAAEKSGLDFLNLNTKEGLIRAFSMGGQFETIYNSIIVEAIGDIIANANPTALLNLANIESVGVGDSLTIEIEPKGLPVAQRNSYMSNVTLLEGVTKQAITITPKVYSTGVQMDYIRILSGTFDWGREVAKVAMSLLYAQYQLVAGLIFSSTLVAGTPFYSAAFSASAVTTMISDLQAVNGGAAVKAYGTLPAFNAASAIATTNYGFETQDEYVRNGFLGRAYGIDNIALPQATDLSVPFTAINKPILLPNNLIVLLSEVGSKPVTLVRENYVAVVTKEANEGALRKVHYSYFMAFDAAIATQANYGVIMV